MRKLDKQIHERKKNWLEHLQRKPSEGAPKKLLHYQPIGRRDPNTKKKMVRWLDISGWSGLTRRW
jgi:hypothetical protein